MFGEMALGSEFFVQLREVDRQIVQGAAAAGCARCGGPLYRSDYPRKARGGGLELPEEVFGQRFSLCCGREGCRRRSTPPSVRFLGRRVYVGAIVLAVAALWVAGTKAAEVARKTGVPARTALRWVRWWQGPLVATRWFLELCGRMWPPLSRERLPASLLERFGGTALERLGRVLVLLAPLTTRSMAEGARFWRGWV